ncbi:TerC/Alx family metal homeostasis membrane protein [Rurimicrobium arvi]|uniref:TerC family protein n=1 Tax=Rurimicrobium arvi TaxID=2049916 RepID=A0ABP8MM03_9BACT
MDKLTNHPAILLSFGVVVLVMLLLDLGVFHKKAHEVSNKEALAWSVVWIGLSMAFSGVVYHSMGLNKFAQFQSAYWIEKALSVDNLFVFILVFQFFKVPSILHHKVLFWGVIGALLFRALFIFSGVELIKYAYLPVFGMFGRNWHVNIVLLLFGIFLIYAGIKSWYSGSEEEASKDFSQSPGARFIHRFFKVSDHFEEDHFFTVKNGVRMVTPLFVVLGVIEFTDLLFAVDSIPAVFAIAPNDPFILYTSNIFAILGLRSLYFLLSNFMHRFSRLKYGLAVILFFIGMKMVIAPVLHISSPLSLGVVAGVLLISVIASQIWPEKK